ncbi:amino acid ABC transporter ATP-binding/permease protein [Glutamicibacter sp. AOP38-B1-38]|uniref:amino acid ABC transporter ATP-binding/permease protein n=1 Tax=Glutamicibacter sp. AOP38-B1-38 TaxID=3457680 RepID=UPI0040333298
MMKPHGQQPSSLASARWLIAQTRDLLPPVLLACLLACLTRLVALAIYLFAGLGLVAAIGLQLPAGLPRLPFGLLVAAIILAGLCKGGLRYAEQYVGHRLAFLALARLRSTMYEAYQRQAPFAAASKNSGSMLAKATRDIDKVEVFFAHTLPPAAAALLVSGAVLGCVYQVFGGTATLILAGGYLLVGLLLPLLGVGALRQAAGSAAQVRGSQNRIIIESLAGIEVLHAFGAGGRMLKRMDEAGAADTREAHRASWVTGLRAALSQIVIWGSALALLLTDSVQGTAATIILVVIAVPSFEPVRAVDGFVLGLQDSLASARRLFATASAPPAVAEPSEAGDLPDTGTLNVQDLTVRHGQREVVQQVDFTVEPGELVALVGASGSGKSSITAALVRALPAGGRLSFGGAALDAVPLQALRSRIVVVSQEAVMVRGTVRENLLLGTTGTTDEELRAVLEELGLGEWLEQQPQGLDTRLADRSTRLSGGQRQRLALARALLRHPALLVMDESTSALDAASEALVLKAINERRGYGMGVLMISHRLSIVQEASEVLVLREGRVVETGSPQQLLADGTSEFYQMVLRENDRIDTGG